jgi:hypothetical protein
MSQVSEIRAKRAQLLARAAVERERVSAQLGAWEAPLVLVDKSIEAMRTLRRHPQWIVAAVVVLAVLRPRRALGWARNGLIAWRAWRWISRSLPATRRPA